MRKKNRFNIISSYWFLGALFLLLLNDFILKQTFHNWFTGKLSDFAGLFMFPLFLSIFFPKSIKHILVATALFFIYWKSSFSTNFIEFFNDLSSYQIARVVDYTDLLALTVLPFAYLIYDKRNELLKFKLHPVFPILITGFALMSTSQAESIVTLNEEYYVSKSLADLRTQILNIDPLLASVQTEVSYISNITNDSLSFNLFISDKNLCQAVYLYPYIIGIDSSSSRIFFKDTDQRCTEKCGVLRKCDTGNTKEEIMEVIESNFIDFI